MRKPAFLFATAAVAWGAAFFAWALLGSAYSSGEPLAHSEDPIQVLLVALPLLVCAAAWLSLHRTCSAGASPWLAGSITVVLLAFSLVGAASVGLLLAPAVFLLGGALATVPQPPAA
jgi:hypothetical protein